MIPIVAPVTPSQLTASPNLPFLRRAEDDGGGGGYARGRGRPDGGVEGRPRQQRGCDSPYVCLPTEPRPHRQTDPAQKGRILFLFFFVLFRVREDYADSGLW